MHSLETASPSRCNGRSLAPRIGFVALAGLGGSSRVACDVALGLAGHGHQTFFLTGPDPQWGQELGDAVPYIEVSAPRTPIPASDPWVGRLAADLVAACLRFDLNALSVHYGVGLAEAAIQAQRALRNQGYDVEVSVTLHGSDVTHKIREPEQRQRLASALHAANRVTAVSHWLADLATSTLGLTRRPLVVRNGVDTRVFHPRPTAAASETTAAQDDRVQLCHASNFRPIKRPLDSIEIVSHLARRGIDAHLSMLGDGPLRAQAEQRANEPDVRGRIGFTGTLTQAQVANRFANTDVVLVTSASESFSLVALEAMSSGTLVVGSRCGGLEEQLETSAKLRLGDMLLAEPGDVERMSQHVESLVTDPVRAAHLRSICLELSQHFDREQQLNQYAKILAVPAVRAPSRCETLRGG